jgi:hypothetical protein
MENANGTVCPLRNSHCFFLLTENHSKRKQRKTKSEKPGRHLVFMGPRPLGRNIAQ